MNKRQLNEGILDAFLDLKFDDESWDDVEKKVNESKTFNLRDGKDVDAADAFLKEEATKDVNLEVIDVDSDTEEHLRDNKDYVGQMLLQCCSCKATKFADADKLVVSEADAKVYNLDDECPHCHSTGTGFTLLGQVGAVKEAEPEVVNDEAPAEDEATVNNDESADAISAEGESPVTAEDTAAEGELVPGEETKEETPIEDIEPDKEEEPSALETTAADDTEEGEPETKLGDEINPDDVPADDTVDLEKEKAEEEKKKKAEKAKKEEEEAKAAAVKEEVEVEPVATPIVEEVDSVKEALDPVNYSIEDLITPHFNTSDLSIKVQDTKGGVLYDGKYEDLTYDISTLKVKEWGVLAGVLYINVADAEESDSILTKASDLIRDIKPNTAIEVVDAETSETLIQGNKDEVALTLLNKDVYSCETAGTVVVLVDNTNDVAVIEELIKPVEVDE